MKNPHITIRQATIEDLKLIQDFNVKLFASEIDNGHDDILDPSWPMTKEGIEYFQKCLTDPDKVTFIAEIESKPVGYVIGAAKLPHSWRKAVVGELENMLVDAPSRRRGVGAALVKALKQWLRQKGSTRLIVKLYSKNIASHAFYKSVGFYDWGIEMEMVL